MRSSILVTSACPLLTYVLTYLLTPAGVLIRVQVAGGNGWRLEQERGSLAATAMLGLGPIGTLKGIKPTGGDAKKPGLGKKPATSTLDFDFSDDDEPGAPCPDARAPQPQHSTHRLG